MFVNLDDTLNVRKTLNSFTASKIWINTHGSTVASNNQYIVPSITNFEQENIYLNLEQRPQKTLKTFNSFFEGFIQLSPPSKVLA